MPKSTKRTRLTAAAERIGKTLGRAAGRIDRWRGKPPAAKKTKSARPVAPVRGRHGSKAHLKTEATRRHDASAAAKANRASEHTIQKTRYRNQPR